MAPFGFKLYPVCNFAGFIKNSFALGTVKSERVNGLGRNLVPLKNRQMVKKHC